MPLSPAEPREVLHTREYSFKAYRRDDELWDLEGHITDVKPYSFPNQDRPGGWVAAGEPIHDMSIRLTLDDRLTIVAIEAVTDGGPYRICPAITPNFQRMVGVRVGPGWRNAVRARLGGAEGCTHLVELLYAMATPAFQGIVPALSRRRRALREAGDEAGAAKPAATWPGLLDSCHAYAHDGEIARRNWPEAAAEAAKRKAAREEKAAREDAS
ncbi:MAG: DUF2889 domain-containing protein [Rhodospirillales bacterium]